MKLDWEFLTSQRKLESPLAWGPQNKSPNYWHSWATSKSIGFWERPCKKRPKAYCCCYTWDPPSCHLSVVRQVKSSSGQVESSSVKWLSKQAWLRGSPPMRAHHSWSSQPHKCERDPSGYRPIITFSVLGSHVVATSCNPNIQRFRVPPFLSNSTSE
jgi:hypothetical protein